MKKIFLLMVVTFVSLHAGDDVVGALVQAPVSIEKILNGTPAVTVEDLRKALSNSEIISEIKKFLIEVKQDLFREISGVDRGLFKDKFKCEPETIGEEDESFFDSNGSVIWMFKQHLNQYMKQIETKLFRFAKMKRELPYAELRKAKQQEFITVENVAKFEREINAAQYSIKKIARAVLLSLLHESLAALFEDLGDNVLYSYQQINEAVQNILGKTYVKTGGMKNKKLSPEELTFLTQNDSVIQLYRMCQELLESEGSTILFASFDFKHILKGTDKVVDDGSAAIVKQIAEGKAIPEGSSVVSGGHFLESFDGEASSLGTGKHDLNAYPCMISPNIHNPYISLNYNDLKPGTHKGLKSMWLTGTEPEEILRDLYNSKMFAYKKDNPSSSSQLRAVSGSGKVIFVGTQYANSLSPQEIKTMYPINVLPYPKDALSDNDEMCVARLGFLKKQEDKKFVDLDILKDLTISKRNFLQLLKGAKKLKNNCYQVYGQPEGTYIVNMTNEMNAFVLGSYKKKGGDDPLATALASEYSYFAWGDAGTETAVFNQIDVVPYNDEKTRRQVKHKNTKINYNDHLYAASVARNPDNLGQYQLNRLRLLYEFMTSSDSDLSDSIDPLLSLAGADASESETSHSSFKEKRDESGDESDLESSLSDRSGRGINRKPTLRKHRQQSGGGGGGAGDGGGGGGAK